jgi:hypothetical protein
MEKTNFLKRGEAVGWKRFRPACAKPLRRRQGGNHHPFGFRCAKLMNTFDFMQATIFHTLKDPHSKTSEPDRLAPLPAIATQSQRGEEKFLRRERLDRPIGFKIPQGDEKEEIL